MSGLRFGAYGLIQVERFKFLDSGIEHAGSTAKGHQVRTPRKSNPQPETSHALGLGVKVCNWEMFAPNSDLITRSYLIGSFLSGLGVAVMFSASPYRITSRNLFEPCQPEPSSG